MSTSQNKITLETLRSLRIEIFFDDTLLSTGTGFVVVTNCGPHLITNRHCVTGRHQDTSEVLHSKGGIPNRLSIRHNRLGSYGHFVDRTENLYDHDAPRWVEHPVLGSKADLVALKLQSLDHVKLYPWDVTTPEVAIKVIVTDALSVIGFPFGISSNSLALWSSGTIASEMEIDHDDLPMFIIDCKARPGQSGSPVVAFRSSGWVHLVDGSSGVYNGPVSNLLGIYSGRVNKESDLGRVWRLSAIQELVNSLK